MNTSRLLVLSSLLALAACSAGAEGDACTSDDDCGEGLECHMEHGDHHEGEDSGEEHSDEEHSDEGVCEAEGEDHEGHDQD